MEEQTKPKKERPKLKCEHCGAEVTRGFFKKHQQRPGCVSARNTKVMERRGWKRAPDTDLIVKILQAAGAPMEQHPTGHGEGEGWGRDKKKSVLKTERWCPAWLTDLFRPISPWKLLENNGTRITEEEGVRLYSRIVRDMCSAPDQREAMDAILTLAGEEGIRGLVFTSRLRAEKLREEARKLREEAEKKEKEADVIDPPEQEEVAYDVA